MSPAFGKEAHQREERKRVSISGLTEIEIPDWGKVRTYTREQWLGLTDVARNAAVEDQVPVIFEETKNGVMIPVEIGTRRGE